MNMAATSTSDEPSIWIIPSRSVAERICSNICFQGIGPYVRVFPPNFRNRFRNSEKSAK